MAAVNVKHTKVYKLVFDLAMQIFEVTKKFPNEETYSLTDQARRSSRSVCITCLKHIGRNNIRHILLQKLAIATWKTPKHQDGWILHWLASI